MGISKNSIFRGALKQLIKSSLGRCDQLIQIVDDLLRVMRSFHFVVHLVYVALRVDQKSVALGYFGKHHIQ